jgi:bifunctional NMN adenylyltransferase/nudix hydrolase
MIPKSLPKTEVGVVIGRFQTHELHEAHIDLISTVLNQHPKVIIFLGLSPVKVTYNNPLDFESRKQMILEKFGDKVIVLYIKDINSDELWSKRLDEQIGDVVGPTQKVTLYGGRDSFISHYKGKYSTVELESERIMSASEIRKGISAKVKSSPDFRAGVIWASQNQYPKVFTTVDIAVFNEDGSKILLARKPDEKLYRLIGGFADPRSDSFEMDAKREVSEEAHIEIGDLQYLGSHKIDDWRYRNETDKIKTLLFSAKYIFGSPQADDDIAELRWFKFEIKLIDEIVEAHRPLYTMLLIKYGLIKDDKDNPGQTLTP